MDAVPRTPAHPMPWHRPGCSDDSSSRRFHSRYVYFWRVGPVARLARLFCLWVGVN